MSNHKIPEELKRYKKAEKIVFYLSVIVGLVIIFLSQKLYQTPFGRASLAYGLISLAMITMLRILKFWGPKE